MRKKGERARERAREGEGEGEGEGERERERECVCVRERATCGASRRWQQQSDRAAAPSDEGKARGSGI